jgi:hypothetical protein
LGWAEHNGYAKASVAEHAAARQGMPARGRDHRRRARLPVRRREVGGADRRLDEVALRRQMREEVDALDDHKFGDVGCAGPAWSGCATATNA